MFFIVKKPQRLWVWLRRVLLVLFAAILIAILPNLGTSSFTSGPSIIKKNIPGTIPIQEQPFYSDLEKVSSNWSDVVIGTVEGDNPKTTLLNFYAVMSLVGKQTKTVKAMLSAEPGIFPSEKIKEHIEDTDMLFKLAVQSVDSLHFPESIRNDMSDEAAIQLKHVLDYVFTHSSQAINIPDYLEMITRKQNGSNTAHSWRIPGTAITLSQGTKDTLKRNNYYFSSDTAKKIRTM